MLEIQKDTGITPKGLAERPILRQDCLKYFKIYARLAASRTIGDGGPQPIQISEVESCLTLHGISGVEEQVRILDIVQTLDGDYMEAQPKTPKGQ